LVLDQVNVALPPTTILDGAAANETVGIAGGVTARVPLVARVPVQPPEALQAVAFLADQLRVELPPKLMVFGVAVNVTVGIPGGWTVSTADDEADPPAPLQVRVYVTW
jgi:hypothetical protein